MEYLERYKNKLVEIYFNDELDKLNVGYIVNEDEDYILLKEISPLGINDGYSLILKKRINMISRTDYLDEIELLMKENSKENILNSYIFKDVEIESNNFDDILDEVKDKKLICTIFLIDDDYETGFITKISKNKITLEYFGEIIKIKKNSIKGFDINGLDNRRDYFIKLKKGDLK